MLDAVLFDWGDTLMQWAPAPDLLEAGRAAGFAALGREPVPGVTERFRDVYLAGFFEPSPIDEVEYPAEVRGLLGEFGVEVDAQAPEPEFEAFTQMDVLTVAGRLAG